jgi:ATP-binding cassette subfamily B protein/subfamily B ATP-binding cassette protein MsbA
MKTGGILSRLTGDVDTTGGLLQMALVSPAISVVRLLIAVVVLLTLNWRLALTALAIVPGVMAISFLSARRIRPIYRSLRQDAYCSRRSGNGAGSLDELAPVDV